jgi:hypothetical protein
MVTAEQWAMAGIIVTVILGVSAFFVARSIRKNRQSQNLSNGSTGYQAGGNIDLKGRE